jgi:hypothetical protein
MPEFQWYEIVEGKNLEQGDILENFELIVTRVVDTASDELKVDAETYDVIIMTQSCDIPKKTQRHIILCPIWSIEEAAKVNSFFHDNEGKEELRRGNVVGYQLLNKCDTKGFERPFRIVEFKRIIEVTKDRVESFATSAGKRIRLLPPYREHLSQAFAKFFMRVGLPIDIPPFR